MASIECEISQSNPNSYRGEKLRSEFYEQQNLNNNHHTQNSNRMVGSKSNSNLNFSASLNGQLSQNLKNLQINIGSPGHIGGNPSSNPLNIQNNFVPTSSKLNNVAPFSSGTTNGVKINISGVSSPIYNAPTAVNGSSDYH